MSSSKTKSKSLSARMADRIDRQKEDAKEANIALRLQVRAWRMCTLIATVDPQRGARVAKWLFFVSVPFVDGVAVQKFLDEEEKKAEEYGKASGVFG